MLKGLNELFNLLKGLKLPVSFDHFDTEQKLPYLIYIVTGESYEYADNTIFFATQNIQLELYTDKKDISLENKVEQALLENELLFEKNEGNIEEGNDRFYMVTYRFEIMKG